MLSALFALGSRGGDFFIFFYRFTVPQTKTQKMRFYKQNALYSNTQREREREKKGKREKEEEKR